MQHVRKGREFVRNIKKLFNILWIFIIILSVTSCGNLGKETVSKGAKQTISIEEVPAYEGEPYVEVENNEPDFSDEDRNTASYEYYSELDEEGKCGVVEANIGQELMPDEERGSIGQVKPTGWHTVKYDNVDGKYLYNRCHLIGYQLTGENANEKNLITGTRYMNTEGMLPFEDMVADYIRETGNHVLYRVTPVFEEDNLLASGVQMEAMSVEDEGEGVSFNVYVYNVQPGIEIDYATGESRYVGKETNTDEKGNYVLNTNTKKYHLPSCSGAKRTQKKNKEEFVGSKAEIEAKGYEPCGACNP